MALFQRRYASESTVSLNNYFPEEDSSNLRIIICGG